ncbi:hypothetical protein BD779DRAFT_1685490 [Infundibulicybe gibba]|nr:hypothetical protein BD779DRAFT_1685490 [Infundibulicybe gibba]
MQKRTKRRVQLRRPAAAVVPVTPADDRAYIRHHRKCEEAATAPRADCRCDETIGTKELLYHAHAHFGHRGPLIQGGDEFLKHQLGNLIQACQEDDEYTFWGRLFPLWFEHFPEHLTGRFLISNKTTLYLAMKMREKLVRDDMNLRLSMSMSILQVLAS